ncbi:MAG: RNA 2'-phosphotransferase [Chitinophagales bacterium]|nr:RNA 2'-phosphotransferase [Chitinophagaceae bacterium]MCB9063925.1 RNA 2'-phosphotransferase [Chitinophagales bacterium]
MISDSENKKISKFLSLVLRHQPEKVGIVLDENGWTDVTELIDKLNLSGLGVNFEVLKYVVSSNNKQRFAFNDTLDKIRANQGHSVDIELNYKSQTPPNILYHGTAEKYLNSIFESGLQKMQRHHVHLSADVDTAIKVGQRHGKPVVLIVSANEMYTTGLEFFLSDNGVWLTDSVIPQYLKVLNS